MHGKLVELLCLSSMQLYTRHTTYIKTCNKPAEDVLPIMLFQQPVIRGRLYKNVVKVN